MNEYETEEQQVEALKKWWKENGNSLIIGLLVGVSGLFGYRAWIDHEQNHAAQASDIYMQIVRNVAVGDLDDKTIDLNNKLINEYSSTPYASLSAMVLARSEYNRGNKDMAVGQLELAVKHATDEMIRQQASLRLASVYIERADFDAAAALLDAEHDPAYDAQFAELRGDLYLAQGDSDRASREYDKAIELQGDAVSPWLKLKRENIGYTPTSVSGPTEQQQPAAADTPSS